MKWSAHVVTVSHFVRTSYLFMYEDTRYIPMIIPAAKALAPTVKFDAAVVP